jgi:pimeloyl-ACP methyl ester carboxylesterase
MHTIQSARERAQPTSTRRSLLQAGIAGIAASLVAGPARAQLRGRTYVLIHGAWFGGWVWKSIADGLRALGHTVYAPSLTGLGDRRHLLRPGINLDTHADDIVNLIQMEDLNQVVLVGWSYGGMVAADVLGRVPERIASMVYLDAFAPERGRSATSYTSRNPPDALVQLAAQGKDIPPLSLQSLGVTDQAMLAYVTPRLSPHPVLTFLQGSKALAERPNIPHTYVLAGAYADMSPNSTFRPFYKQFEEDPRAKAYVLNTSHVMMLTDPSGTLDILKDVR